MESTNTQVNEPTAQKESSNTSSVRAGTVVTDSRGRAMVVTRILEDDTCECIWHESSLFCEARIPKSLLTLE